MRWFRSLAVAAAILAPLPAAAQTNPNLTYGQVLTPAQWNNLFASKQDYLGAPPLLTSGGTMTGKLVTATPNTSVAGLNLPAGTAPSAPVNGDMWTTTAGLFVRINGTTIGPLIGSTGAPVLTVSNSDSTLTISPTSGNVIASLNLTHANTWTGAQTFSAGATVGTGLTVTGFFTATGLVTNADLLNPSMTVNGTTCTLGASCSPSATAASITVGTTTIISGATTRILYENLGVLGEYTISGSGTVVAMQTGASLITPAIGVATGTSLALGGCTIGTDVLCTTGTAAISSTLTSAAHTITSASANALAVGRQGATNPVLQVDASTATVATGLKIKGAAAAGGLALSVITSGTNENMTIDAAGSGTITFGATSTGAIIHTRATTLSAALTYGGVTLSNSVSGTGSMVLSTGASLVTPAIGVATGTSLALGGCTIGSDVFCGTGSATLSSTISSGNHIITTTIANALVVGRNGATNPAFQVDASTASSATGIKIKSAAAAGGVAMSVITSGTNENLTIDAAGSGTITIAGTSTGAITLTRATTMSAALTYGGVTLSNSVTGTGSMVLSTGASLTTPALGVATGTSLALGGCTLSANAFCATGTAAISSTLTSAAHTITSASATALAVGLNGSTNPALQVDASTASSATGFKIKSAAAAAGLALSVITSGTNENLTIDAAAAGTITLGATSTGNIVLTRAVTLTNGLTAALPLTSGGTGQITALAARASSGLNIDQANSTGDANGTIAATDRTFYHTALSAARSDTLPAASALNAGQLLVIWDPRGVATASNTVSLARAGADTVNGGTSFTAINAAYGVAFCWSDAVSRWDCIAGTGGGGGGVSSVTVAAGAGITVSGTCTITTSGTCTAAQVFGSNSLENCTLAESHTSNNVTFSLKTQSGGTPSASDICVVSFGNATIGTGDYTAVQVTAATTVVLNSGSTLGTANNVPFRVWVTAWNNAGTVVLGVSVNSAANQTYPINPWALQSSTACNACAGATSSGVYYTTATQTSKAIRVVGFATYDAGLATAGAWSAAPTSIRMWQPGTPLPGQPTGQIIAIRDVAQLSTTSSTPQPSGSDITITLGSSVNGVRFSYTGSGQTNTTATQMQVQVYRATSSACTTGVATNLALTSGLATTQNPFSMGAQINFPRTASTVTYHYLVCALSSDNTSTIILSASGSNEFLVEEIQGALPEPANDNVNPGVLSMTG